MIAQTGWNHRLSSVPKVTKTVEMVPSTQALSGIQEEEVEVEVQISRCSRLEGIVQGSGM